MNVRSVAGSSLECCVILLTTAVVACQRQPPIRQGMVPAELPPGAVVERAVRAGGAGDWGTAVALVDMAWVQTYRDAIVLTLEYARSHPVPWPLAGAPATDSASAATASATADAELFSFFGDSLPNLKQLSPRQLLGQILRGIDSISTTRAPARSRVSVTILRTRIGADSTAAVDCVIGPPGRKWSITLRRGRDGWRMGPDGVIALMAVAGRGEE